VVWASLLTSSEVAVAAGVACAKAGAAPRIKAAEANRAERMDVERIIVKTPI
jgi:hypothetical protein